MVSSVSADRFSFKTLFHMFWGVDRPEILYFQPLSRTKAFSVEYPLELVCFGVSASHNGFMEKNKQFIKLYHKYIHNINEDILQIYIILQYTVPFRRESFQQQTVLF